MEGSMTPQEAQLIEDLFNRLANLESAPRDAEAERIIATGLARAPHAVYALVQTVLVQDEALRRADARIRELSGEDQQAPEHGSFLDSMRAAFGGRPGRGSVPSVPPAPERSDPRYGGPTAAAPATGGSFLGTAAASAAGAIGGGLLLSSISSMFGHRGGSAFAAVPGSSPSPLDQSAAGSDLARGAGLGDVNQSGGDDDLPGELYNDDEFAAGDENLSDDDDFDSGDFGGDDS